MYYPYGRCGNCGERLYGHIDGGYQCVNCGATYSSGEFDDGGRKAALPAAR